jgi:hypothetical protein
VNLSLRRCTDSADTGILDVLLDIHDACYTNQVGRRDLHPRARFSWLLEAWTERTGWECVIGYDDEQPVGFAHGAPLAAAASWWRCMADELDPEFTRECGTRTFALADIMIRLQWRKSGAAARIHDELLAGRPEQRATLLVDSAHTKVQSLYQSWGYRAVGRTWPFDHAAETTAMVKDLPR